MKRRTVLAAVGTATAGLAGCLASGSDGDGNGSDDDAAANGGENDSASSTNDGDSSGDASPPALEGSEIETTGSGCAGSDAGSASAQRSEGTVTIDGVIRASNPCHEAVLADAAIRNRQLVVRVDTAAREGICEQCLGAIEYEVTADVANADGLQGVTVEHASGQEYTFEWDESEASSP